MDFKNILSRLNQLNESKTTDAEMLSEREFHDRDDFDERAEVGDTYTKGNMTITKTKGGTHIKHKSDDDMSDSDDDKKKEEPKAKRGRGRPKKGSDETGAVKTYKGAKQAQDVMIGKLPKGKLPGKASKKHKLKEWIEEIENKYVSEALAVGQKPIPVVGKAGDTQQTGAGFLSIDDNSPAGQAIQKALGDLAQQKKAQIVVPTTPQTAKPAAGATGQAPAGQQQVREKWAGDAKVKATGEYAGKSVEQLKSMLAKLHKSGPHKRGSEEEKKMRQINFALRSKGHWKKGEGAAQKESMSEGQLNEIFPAGFGAAIGAGLKAIGPVIGKIAQTLGRGASTAGKAVADVAGKTATGVGRGVADVSKEVGKAAVQNAPAVGMGIGAYEIAKQFADKMPDAVNKVYTDTTDAAKAITSVVGNTLNTNTIIDIAGMAVKYALPVGLFLGVLYGGKKLIDKMLSEADIPSTQGIDTRGAGLGAGRSDTTLESKKTKPDFLDIDKDGNKKESMKKAAKDKKKVDESMDNKIKAARHTGKAHALSKQGYNCHYDDMEEARMYHEGYKEGLDECYGQVPIVGAVVDETDIPATVPGMADQAEGLGEADMEEGNAFTAALARTPQGGKFSVGGKTFTDRSGYDSKVDETMFESWDKELNSLLKEYNQIEEGLTVSISKGQQGAPDSVSVTAQDQEADQLLSIIKSAGLGLFGAEGNQPEQSSPMSLQPTDDGSEEGDIDVVGDHDGMMALIKKVTGGAGMPDAVAIGGNDHDDDYEDEQDDHDHDEHEDTDEEACNECGMPESKCGCDKEMVDEVESEDQMAYEVAEDNAPDSGAAEEEEEIQDTAQANQSAAETEEAEDSEEEEETVDESAQLDEWANEAGQKGTDAQFETDIAFMTKVIAGGLNKEKATGQTTIPVIPGQNDRMGYNNINESISDFKKLAGLK